MKLNIALLAGDGIGPEVIDQAVKVSEAIATKFKHEITWKPALTGAAAIDAVGEPYPDATHDICLASDAVLFGAIGHPRFDNDPTATVRPEQGLLKMRKKLGLFANVRPTFTFPSLLDKSPLKRERIEGTVGNFVALSEGNLENDVKEQGTPYYDGLKSHRLITDFMIQVGCQQGSGTGRPDYTFDDQFHSDLIHDAPGKLAMANYFPATNGRQLYITHVPTPLLDVKHTVFGSVIVGPDIVDAIAQ